MCGGGFPTDAEDEIKAEAECQKYFGDVPKDDRAVVCDGCWEKIHPAKHPAKHLTALIEQAAGTKDRLGREML